MDAKSLGVLEFDKVRRLVAEHASFGAGRALALALTPASEGDEVERRLALTAQATDFLDRRGASPLAGAHDLRPEVEAAARGRILLPAELLEIRDTLSAARTAKGVLAKDRTRWPALAAVAAGLDECPALYDALAQALGDDGEVLDAASAELRRLRKRKRIAHDRLTRRLQDLMAKPGFRDLLQEPLVTQRSGRYVVPVISAHRSKVPGVVHDTSDSGATVFIEPMSVVEGGNSYREATVQEEKEVERVLRALSGHVGAEAAALRDTIAALAELDLWFAAAQYGARTGGLVPEIVAGPPRVDFRRARHPLLPAEEVVPIDVRVGDDFRVLVITGPNTGGKTVALKSVGLLTVMAQAGLPIPCAEGSALGVFDAVWADIGDEQSIEQSLSTFSGHMTNIVGILEAAGSRSLVLLDELGAGTDPSEGAALAVALLEAFRARGAATVASTHYSELKAYAHQTEGVTNASVEFDVESLRPTYELAIGLPGRSNALAIARRLGLPEEVLADAREGIAAQHVALEDMLAEIHAARSAAEEDRAVASESRRDADAWAQKLDTALARLEREREDILARAREEAAEELQAARRAIRRLERQARTAMKDEAGMAEVVAMAGAAHDEAAALARRGASGGRPGSFVPKRGDPVSVRGYQQPGEILEVRRDGKVEVAIGQVRMTVDARDLAPAATTPGAGAGARAPGVGAPPRAPRPRSPAPDGPTLSVDLRGLRVDEGLDRLDAHLDRAVLADAPWVHIIHGHGTGAMKRAVRDALSDHPQVAAFRPGKVGEGGDGVTVVRLR